MNVGLFASAFYPHTGGVEETTRQIAHAQQQRGERPLIITNRWPKRLPAVEEYENLPIRRYVFRVPERELRQFVGAALYGWPTLMKLTADLRQARVELVHVQCVGNNAYYALHARRRLGCPLVVTLQGELTMDAHGLYQRSALMRNLLRTILTSADAVTACSQQTLAEAEGFLGHPLGDKASVIYNGIRLDDFAGTDPGSYHRPYVFAIGRHVHQKGFDVLLRAFAWAVRSGASEHDLVLAGDGEERPRLEQLAHELGIRERVQFAGRLEHDAAVRLFLGCTFFVLPSRHEPMGIVNLEAMAAGKAVIASRVGGVPELIQDGVTGLLVPGEDAEALTVAITRLLSDPALSTRLGTAGRHHVAAFDWSIIASQYAAVYRYAADTKASRQRFTRFVNTDG